MKESRNANTFKNANTICIGKVAARKILKKNTITKFSTIFRNCDWYGKEVNFKHFFNKFFSEIAKMDILKMSKNQFPKHFCIFLFLFYGFLTENTKRLSVL